MLLSNFSQPVFLWGDESSESPWDAKVKLDNRGSETLRETRTLFALPSAVADVLQEGKEKRKASPIPMVFKLQGEVVTSGYHPYPTHISLLACLSKFASLGSPREEEGRSQSPEALIR